MRALLIVALAACGTPAPRCEMPKAAARGAPFLWQVTRAGQPGKVVLFGTIHTASTPDIAALERKARSEHIPVVPITETLHPATASFEAWQVSQFDALRRALSSATGR